MFQVYNRVSWLNALSKLMKVGLEHDDAPVLLKFAGEFRQLLSRFREVRIVPELSGEVATPCGWKGTLYNTCFVDVTLSRARSCGASAGTCWRSVRNNHDDDQPLRPQSSQSSISQSPNQ